MTKRDLSATLKSLSDQALLKTHDDLHGVVDHTREQIEAHHLVAEELRSRGLNHPHSDATLHKAIIEMSRIQVPVSALAKMIRSKEVDVIAQMAMENGTPFADVYELLTAHGWTLRAVPASEVDPGMDAPPEQPDPEDEYRDLNERQKAVVEMFDSLVDEYGKFDQSSGADGAHYMADNPFSDTGMACVNCVSFQGGGACEWVEGSIDPQAVCKLWVIAENLIIEKVSKAIGKGSFVRWNSSGGPAQGQVEQVKTAGTLSVPDSSFSVEGTKDDPALLIRVWRKGADGWAATDTLVGHKTSTVSAIQSLGKGDPTSSDVHVDTIMNPKPRRRTHKADGHVPPQGVQEEAKRALKWIEEDAHGYGFTQVGHARARQLANGEAVSLKTVQRMASYLARHEIDKKGKGWNPGEPGYPSAGRVAWAAWGGDPAKSWTAKVLASADKSLIVKSVDEQRFTLGPWYVPNMEDAHGEWTDPVELQVALWDYVKKGNRDIRLQHTPETKAGEWVEAMTMPFEVDVPMILPGTDKVTKQTFPAGTVFLGVQWEDWAWDMVKRGQIRGYSIGGSAERVDENAPIMVDIQEGME